MSNSKLAREEGRPHVASEKMLLYQIIVLLHSNKNDDGKKADHQAAKKKEHQRNGKNTRYERLQTLADLNEHTGAHLQSETHQ